MGSLEHNLKSFGAINLKPGTDTCVGSGKMPFHFGVTGVNFGVTECKNVKSILRGYTCFLLNMMFIVSLEMTLASCKLVQERFGHI